MHRLLQIFLIFLLLNTFSTLSAYDSEDKFQVVIIGKIAKYVNFPSDNHNNFVITVLNNPFENIFDETYKNKKIKSKPIKINYIDNIEDLKFTHILYIPKSNSLQLPEILKYTKNKNILTISDIRGFSQKGGMVQLSFVSQKLKIKINVDMAKKENLKIKSTLLRIVDIIKGYN